MITIDRYKAKGIASAIRSELKGRVGLDHGQALDFLARILGHADWNTLSPQLPETGPDDDAIAATLLGVPGTTIQGEIERRRKALQDMITMDRIGRVLPTVPAVLFEEIARETSKALDDEVVLTATVGGDLESLEELADEIIGEASACDYLKSGPYFIDSRGARMDIETSEAFSIVAGLGGNLPAAEGALWQAFLESVDIDTEMRRPFEAIDKPLKPIEGHPVYNALLAQALRAEGEIDPDDIDSIEDADDIDQQTAAVEFVLAFIDLHRDTLDASRQPSETFIGTWSEGPVTKARMPNGRIFLIEKRGDERGTWISGQVTVSDDVTRGLALEAFLDVLSEALTGTDILMNFSYKAVGIDNGEIVYEVTGDIDGILDVYSPAED